ncbi:MAG: DEAD/DEAH box helicase family protein [Massilibacteroides sp.]|nr:DEAD/DEAH box helicase family protein [Massilibacteroides sp.]MDD4532031.1 DEAD/DEAH box helicase family protein [Bacilli bacterium]
MLKEITWPNHRRFKSRTEWEPVGFFSECLCNATQFDLMLGFFSSSAISVLSDGFASFLYNGGQMRLIINDVLTEQDRNAIEMGETSDNIPFFDLSNIEKIKDTLSERDVHFFECLAWLIKNNRLEIKIIAPKNSIGISHTKSGAFSDGINTVGFDGSCNFSRTALVDNIESLTVSCDWDGNIEMAKINSMKDDFELVFQGKDDNVIYVDANNVKTQIATSFKDKSLNDLLDKESQFLRENIHNKSLPKTVLTALDKAKNRVEAEIERLKEQEEKDILSTKKVVGPRFPYESGPRDYQIKAFENWKANGQKGLFAMATGTGKTITSLNCLLEIHKYSGYYKALILVPTVTLVEQWEIECRKFKFDNIIKVCSKIHDWKTDVANFRMLEMSNSNNKLSYIIIATYASFVRSNVFLDLNQFPPKKLLLIADEAHNMGGGQMINRLADIKYLRRIGLSATLERQFDESGNRKLMNFFGCSSNYTIEYSMSEAIENGALCKYYYYPHLVKLTEDEMYEYIELSKKIAKIMRHDDADSQEILKRLLLKRKRIIHKAENKKSIFENIVKQRISSYGSIKYTLVYVPEGNKPDDNSADMFDMIDTIQDDEETAHLIDEYTRIVRDLDSHIIVRQFTSESTDRDEMLKDFAIGKIDVLTSMKCLDEGVNVPRSELAIFCASTGNPRQFIQRRGRVLRTHKDKRNAIIHDLVVIPDNNLDATNYELEKTLVANEIKRVRDFALLSENCHETIKELDEILNYYNISIF